MAQLGLLVTVNLIATAVTVLSSKAFHLGGTNLGEMERFAVFSSMPFNTSSEEDGM